MRARPREINIFNMSLLDILCGALGAFCFMMLVALPYYSTGSNAQKQNEETIVILLKEFRALTQGIADPALAEKLYKKIDELEAQIKQLEGRANQLAYEKQQLQEQNQDLAAKHQKALEELLKDGMEIDELQEENRETKQALAAKKPFVVMAESSTDQAVDLYLERSRFVVMGQKWESFNPTEPFHRSPVEGDWVAVAADNGVSAWVNATTAPGEGYRVYVKQL